MKKFKKFNLGQELRNLGRELDNVGSHVEQAVQPVVQSAAQQVVVAQVDSGRVVALARKYNVQIDGNKFYAGCPGIMNPLGDTPPIQLSWFGDFSNRDKSDRAEQFAQALETVESISTTRDRTFQIKYSQLNIHGRVMFVNIAEKNGLLSPEAKDFIMGCGVSSRDEVPYNKGGATESQIFAHYVTPKCNVPAPAAAEEAKGASGYVSGDLYHSQLQEFLEASRQKEQERLANEQFEKEWKLKREERELADALEKIKLLESSVATTGQDPREESAIGLATANSLKSEGQQPKMSMAQGGKNFPTSKITIFSEKLFALYNPSQKIELVYKGDPSLYKATQEKLQRFFNDERVTYEMDGPRGQDNSWCVKTKSGQIMIDENNLDIDTILVIMERHNVAQLPIMPAREAPAVVQPNEYDPFKIKEAVERAQKECEQSAKKQEEERKLAEAAKTLAAEHEQVAVAKQDLAAQKAAVLLAEAKSVDPATAALIASMEQGAAVQSTDPKVSELKSLLQGHALSYPGFAQGIHNIVFGNFSSEGIVDEVLKLGCDELATLVLENI